MRKQMAKLHRPHRTSGYIAGVEYEADDRPRRSARLGDDLHAWPEGPDRVPGVHEEGQAGRAGLSFHWSIPNHDRNPSPKPEPEPTGLERELVGRGVTRAVAADLVRDFPEDRIRRQIEVVDWLRETKPKRVADVGAYLAEAIRKDFARRPVSGARRSVPRRRRPPGRGGNGRPRRVRRRPAHGTPRLGSRRTGRG